MKRILLTGATGNIGQPIAKYLGEKQYELVLAGRDQTKLLALARQINKVSQSLIHTVTFNYEQKQTFLKIKGICKTGLDGLVLMTPRIPPYDGCFAPEKEWENLFKTTFIQPLSFLETFIEELGLPDCSKVVIISGITSVQLCDNYALNGAIRAAWLAQAKSLAHYYDPQQIHFNTLSLGGVMTESFIKKLQDEAVARNMNYEALLSERTANVPLRKYASTREVAQAVESLLSQVTNHMTGINFICDGGFIKTY